MKHLCATLKQTIEQPFVGSYKQNWTSGAFMWMACPLSYFHLSDREVDGFLELWFFFFCPFHEGDEVMAEGSGQADQGTQAGAALESILLTLHLHALSLIHCLPPSLILSLSVYFPSSHILLSSSTYFCGGGGCRSTTRSSVWETQSKTGTDSPRCTDHCGGLHPLSSPLCSSLILHLEFALYLGWGHSSPHITLFSLPPPWNYTHTTHAPSSPCPSTTKSLHFQWGKFIRTSLKTKHLTLLLFSLGKSKTCRHYIKQLSVDCDHRIWIQ